MNRDTLILAILTGLALVAVTVLAFADKPVPELLSLIATALAGALTGSSLPARKAAGGPARGSGGGA